MAAITRSRVSRLNLPVPLKTFETVMAETPARAATALIVTLPPSRGRLERCIVAEPSGRHDLLWFNDKPSNASARLVRAPNDKKT